MFLFWKRIWHHRSWSSIHRHWTSDSEKSKKASGLYQNWIVFTSSCYLNFVVLAIWWQMVFFFCLYFVCANILFFFCSWAGYNRCARAAQYTNLSYIPLLSAWNNKRNKKWAIYTGTYISVVFVFDEIILKKKPANRVDFHHQQPPNKATTRTKIYLKSKRGKEEIKENLCKLFYAVAGRWRRSRSVLGLHSSSTWDHSTRTCTGMGPFWTFFFLILNHKSTRKRYFYFIFDDI